MFYFLRWKKTKGEGHIFKMAIVHKCDLCSFSTKNGYLFKRHTGR